MRETKKKATADATRAMDIKLIKMGQSHLAKTAGLDDEAYRAMLARLCDGKTSSTLLTWQERRKVLDHMATLGFVVRRKDGRPSMGRVDYQVDKLRKMWHELALKGAVETQADLKAVDAAIEAWSQRMLGKDWPGGLRLVPDRHMSRLIEAMKKWCLRMGINLEDDRFAEATRKPLEGGR